MRKPSLSEYATRIDSKAIVICLVLSTLVLATYAPSLRNGFVAYDDPTYITENHHIQEGFTWAGVAWAFGNLREKGIFYWHPLSWLSHMLDCQIFGLKPWGHHLTSVLLHAANTLLVFLVFKRMTGVVWRCAVLAALFGLHPLQVDSVAWVAERKSVLSTFFWLLTLWAYIRYTEEFKFPNPTSKASVGPKGGECNGVEMERAAGNFPQTDAQPSLATWWYILAVVLFALGLMCKPVLVTLPFVLLLLDFWPLHRFQLGTAKVSAATLARLVLEKAAFFILAAASSFITLTARDALGNLDAASPLTLDLRLENALLSYCRYLGKVCFPSNLSVFYPHQGAWPMEYVIGAGLVLLCISVLTVILRKQRPCLLMGWLWFLGTVVPMIGLIQVGQQAIADRFMYVPIIGLFLALVWLAADLTSQWRSRTVTLSVASAGAVLVGIALTCKQTGYWRDSESLFRHALASTENNDFAHANLGETLLSQGRLDEALGHFREAVRLRPDFIGAHINLGATLQRKGLLDQAAVEYQEALRLKPDWPEAYCNLGLIALQKGRPDEALAQFRKAVEVQPDYADGHYNLGRFLLTRGQTEEAISHLHTAMQLEPNDVDVINALAWIRAANPDARFRDGPEALRLAGQACQATGYREPIVLVTLGAAYAENERFEEAAATAEQARLLALANGQKDLALKSEEMIRLYKARQPYREP